MRHRSGQLGSNFSGPPTSRNGVRPHRPAAPLDRDVSTQDIAIASTNDEAFLYALPTNALPAPILLPTSWIDANDAAQADAQDTQAKALAWRRRRITAAVEIATCVRQTCLSLDAASRVMTARIKEIDRVIDRVDHLTKVCASARKPRPRSGPNVPPVQTAPTPSMPASPPSTVTFIPVQGNDDSAEGRAVLVPKPTAEAVTASLPAIIADAQNNRVPGVSATVTEGHDTPKEVVPVGAVGEHAIVQEVGNSIQPLHPGIDGSSSVTIAMYKEQRTAVVTVQAAVRVHPCLQSRDSSSDTECLLPCGREPHMDVAVAFAASAAAQAATDCSRDVLDLTSPVLDTKGSSAHPHEPILSTLQNGHVEGVEHRTVSEFSHISYILKLRNPETGHKCKAIFKPRAQGDFDGWHRTPIERVAYLLNLQLGMDLVPPTVYRHGLTLDHESFPQDGAMIFFVDEMKDLMGIEERDWGVGKESLLSDTRILDVLLHNSDRHGGHFGWGKHWTKDKKLPILIDHAAGFRNGANVCMHHENAFSTGPTVRVVPSTYLRLKLLDAAVIAKQLQGILTPAEIVDVVKRRDGILSYLDARVEKHGIENVLVA